MAIRTFCDACNKEIKKGDEFANIQSIEKQYKFNKKGTSDVNTVQVSRLACGECFKQIKKVFDDGQKTK